MTRPHRGGRLVPWIMLLALLFTTEARAADLTAGKAKAKMCAACHGLNGLSKVADAPNLAGNGELYLARQLKAFRSGERKHPQMSVIAASLSDEDIAQVTAWYSAIKVNVELPQ
ncbi:cytochrome C [Stutzerimonas stutzeri]|uniref:Cytochrome C n=1 Tax=Stutzerimonas stutzeri TaxID=316 RepID=W8QU61_STUST|nr:cytochrome c [Stutzerimonas stutzeri]AHL73829.1 cytochrome C [Stutzerimonas stutzeri]MCQ4328654.1 cytochrome c [Stutzerimonas stutzeri]